MVPVLVGANDADLASSPAQTKDALFAPFGVLASQARTLYDPRGDASLKALIQTIIADGVMVEPSRYLAEVMARASQPAYFYRFSYVPELQRGQVPGAAHAAEIVFVFDAVTALPKEKASAADIAMGHTVSGYWTAFVKTGNPNGGDRVAWPRYDPATGSVLHFTNEGVKVGADPLQARLDLWQSVWEQGR